MDPVHIPSLPAANFPLPPRLEGLRRLAYNLHWAWHPRTRNLWSLIDRTAWNRYRNPIPVISGPTEWSRVLDDEKFLAEYQDVLASFDAYMANGSDHWFQRTYGGALDGPIAYFCAEYGVHESLGIYSGGLGILAGDHMKTASDMALPFLGVGLLYRKGYFRQQIDADGHQEHNYPDYDLSRLPLSRVQDEAGLPLTVTVELPGRDLVVAVWLAQVGRVPVLLLDTDVAENAVEDRPITHILYVRGREMRLHQELVLGIGGVRAIRALGLEPSVWHLNEGHSAFLLAERAREYVGEGLDLDDAWTRVRRDSVFTIHTPVSAGNERFDADLVRRVAGPLLDRGDVAVERVLDLGLGPDGDRGQFDMTAFSLRLTNGANAVSQLHAVTANATWQGTIDEPILGITNGVHSPTWVGQPVVGVLERHLDADLDRIDAGGDQDRFWDRLERVPAEDLWEAHLRQKRELAIFARGRLRNQFARHGESPAVLAEVDEALDPKVMTIGFARRFATYKRAGLLFSDIDRLARLIWDAERPIQILFAGKAHPADRPGQRVIQEIFQRSRSPQLRNRVYILEDYDMRVGRFLVQGVDVWLNNPRRPLEASGTSGMKAAQNGVPNISVLDGWWDEGYTGDNGWAIGGRDTDTDEAAQDWADAQALYELLENDLIPRYYERDRRGVPTRWVEVMRRSMTTSLWRFSTTRMLHEYTEGLYLPAAGVEVQRVTREPVVTEAGLTAVARISLALALHNHQPVGNFGWVFAEVYERAYEPMVAALEGHPGVRLSLHYTGPLLEWLVAERPDFIDRLRALADSGQVEILGGGYYEPVLASLPERDRIGQLRRMGDELEARFGRRPGGAWLAERVWEPDLPTSLVAAGYRWTILDDAHFRAAAIPEAAMWGPYTTEDQGHLLRVFGTEQGLRYRIPFRAVGEVIDYLREHATEGGERVGMMGDDGEKFGAWPSTYEHCWGEGRWVEDFFEALEANADWLTTTTPSAWLADHAPIGRVYVPTGSYAEMGEWALPPDESLAYADAVHRARDEHRPELRWLRGAFWRNFQVKYREINDLHKQMLRASEAVAAMPDDHSDRERALDHLFQGQSNDCYWHGLFGGIYISHMRLATYEHLIAAEDLAATAVGTLVAAERRDLDLDGVDEVRLADTGQVVTVDLDGGAGIGGWDVRAVRHALAAVMRRRPEAYHDLLRAHAHDADGEPGGSEGATSIHDVFKVKEEGLAERLVYDAYERRSGLVRVLETDASPDDWASARATELGDAVDGAFGIVDLGQGRLIARREATLAGQPVTITKTLILGGDRRAPTLELGLELEHRGDAPIDVRLGIEWSITMLGGGGNPSAWWELEDGTRTGHDQAGQAPGMRTIAQGNDYLGVAVRTTLDEPTDAWFAPIETISNSEDGYERVYQGSGLLLSWPLRLEPGERWGRIVRHAVTTTRDRRDEAP